MINIISQLLSDHKECKISDNKTDRIIISSSEEVIPEDYIMVHIMKDIITVKEMHRDHSTVLLEIADRCQAGIVASVISMRLLCPLHRDDRVEQLKEYVANGDFVQANHFLANQLSGETYEIHSENVDKISYLEHDGKADVKYRKVFLVSNASKIRAYAVLYNYARKMEYIKKWYQEKNIEKWKAIDCDTVAMIYILGELPEKVVL